MTDDLGAALRERVVVLDGGLGTHLEARGADVSGELWSARVLRDDPELVRAAHADFVAAGAEVVISASYQLGYGAALPDGEVDRLIRLSVAVARDSGARWVAASVGPYGAVRADGSEYTGDYGRDAAELRAWHRRRLAALADAGADVLAVETVASPLEAEVLAAELDALGVPSFVSMSGDSTALDARGLRAALRTAAGARGVLAVGVNCCRPARTAALLAAAPAGAALVAYPNAGRTWDASTRTWRGEASGVADLAPGWAAAGARLIGGCCGTTPADVAAIAARVSATTRT
ncbi:homocysteine S-methyltransferase [Microbacterium sp. 10M-3C3]|jgi:homocysteine S-methyltransferase|uniref:homocysteine S-methyltransferase n=1 Tax=Microbacterium sp. 10M-3C3 TaxID=2483401 RepID=UPI000F63AAA2|nr:homocysteine S-methyltransferase [Microbacterium sp. 10M-3C3]